VSVTDFWASLADGACEPAGAAVERAGGYDRHGGGLIAVVSEGQIPRGIWACAVKTYDDPGRAA
jgi:hypothetical protein